MGLSAHLATIEALRKRRKTTARAALLSLEEIISRGKTIASAYGAYAARRTKRIAVPFYDVRETVALAETFIATYYADLDYPPDLFTALRKAIQGLLSLHSLRRAFASQTSPAAGATSAFVPGPAPLMPYRLQQGDTLERIALRFLGSVDRAWEILDLNNLVYPYVMADRPIEWQEPAEFTEEYEPSEFMVHPIITREGVPDGVLVPGEVLWLPSDANVPRKDVADRDVELWGRDMALPDGFATITDNGQLGCVEGPANITQALSQRVRTRRGEFVLFPAYGMEQLLAVGVEGTRSNAIIAGLEVARTVRQDARVSRVRNLEVLFEDTVNLAAMNVGLIGPSSAEISLNLIIPESLVAA